MSTVPNQLLVPAEAQRGRELMHALLGGLDQALLGQSRLTELVVMAIAARGHVLLEGLPGLGKTELVKALAALLALTFRRVQFTPDLLPSDITGGVVLEENAGRRSFRFHQGPLFANLVLADEINRASPKTQAALLEAMQERRVTVLGETHALPEPHFVLATQNPIELEGTYPLPEAQLDRFLFKVDVLGVGEEVLATILTTRRRGATPKLERALSTEALHELFALVDRVFLPKPVATWIARLVTASHPHHEGAPDVVKKHVKFGASPRAAIAIAESARAAALLAGRPNVDFADVERVASPAMAHRIVLQHTAKLEGITAPSLIASIASSVPALEGKLSRGARVRTLLALVLALASTVLAQETKVEITDGTQRFGNLRMIATASCENSLGLGYLDAEVTNATAEPLSVEVLLHDGSSTRGSRIRKQLRLAPRGRERFWMPYTSRSYYNLVTVTAGSAVRTSPVQSTSTRDRLLFVATDPGIVSGWSSGYASHLAARGTPKRARPRRSGTAASDDLIARAPSDLPPLWQWLTGFEAIVVDSNASGLTHERQELLASYAQAGGTLIVLHASQASAGPLAELIGQGAGTRAPLRPSFGAVVTVDDDGLAELSGGRIDALLEKIGARPNTYSAGIFAYELLEGASIPGLGRSPTRWFVVFTVLFILFVLGSLWYYGRRKQTPLKLLLVIPATGFGTAAVVLGFGYFSEGFTTKGVVEAVSLLDQRSQRHVTISRRTLYAPISPRALVPDADTAIFGSGLPPMNWDRSSHALEIDVDTLPRIGGAALPSRTITAFAASSTGKTRERVSFRSEGDGLRLLCEAGLAAAPSSPVVVCDLAGNVHTGPADGVLKKVSDGKAGLEAFAAAMRTRAPLERGSYRPRPPVTETGQQTQGAQDLTAIFEQRFSSGLPPGTFVMLVGESPLLDAFGLSVEWRERAHLVVGTLAAEDFVK